MDKQNQGCVTGEAVSPFYLLLESGVREWVRRFRDAGLNTESSCHHEGTIQIQCLDPTTELREIKTVFIEHGVREFTADLNVNSLICAIWTVRSNVFLISEDT